MSKKRAPQNYRLEDKDLARAMQGLRRSNAAAPHVPQHRKGTRGQRERDAIRDQGRDIQ